MYEGYTKLFSSIITSTIWQEDKETKLVWITMLALSDQHGDVPGSIPGLANLAGVSIQECEKAIQKLLSPDPYSRTQDNDGRRIVVVDGGWNILNRKKYAIKRDPEARREQVRKAVKKHREKTKETEIVCNPECNQCNPRVSPDIDIGIDIDNKFKLDCKDYQGCNQPKDKKTLEKDYVMPMQKKLQNGISNQKLALKLCDLFAAKPKSREYTAICNLTLKTIQEQHKNILEIAKKCIESPTAVKPMAIFFSELKRLDIYSTDGQ